MGGLHVKYSIFVLTLLLLFPILIIRVYAFNTTLFWLHSLLMLTYLLFIYNFAYLYKPVEDLNHRPTVTVIVPCKNEEKGIAQTITGIIRSDYPADKLKVIIIDDGSTDQTYKVAKQYENDRVKIIRHEKNKGKRHACATGFRASESEIVVCIDSDTVVAKDAIRLLVQPFMDNKVVAVSGHGEAANKDKNVLTQVQHYWYQRMFIIMKGMESKLNTVTCCSGLLAAYRRDGVNEIIDEWLDEKFMGRHILFSDDRQLTNLSARGVNGVSTKDAKVVYQSNAIGYTMVPDNFPQFFKQQLRWKRGWLHGARLASKFMWRKKFPIPIYYYCSIAFALCMPAIIINWMIIAPLSGNISQTVIYVSTLVYIAIIHGLNTWCLSPNTKNKKTIEIDKLTDYMFYMVMFVPLTIVLAILNIYAWSTLWKMGWITRSDKIIKENNRGELNVENS